MSDEAITHAGDDEVGLMTSTVALSGAVAVIAHVEGPMLHIASCGDCVAVLGNKSHIFSSKLLFFASSSHFLA